MSALFGKPLSVINVGLPGFAGPIAAAGAPVSQVEWRPPAGGEATGRIVADLLADPRIDAANAKAFAKFLSGMPMLAGVGIARDRLPGMRDRMILHSGPPIAWERMAGPMRGGVLGAILLEGWATDLAEAERLAASGDIAFDPCHHHDAVGPMAGIISPSMPVWIIENGEHGNHAFSNMNEGLGKVLRMGANGPDVLARLAWMRDTLFPAMEKALAVSGPIELKPLMARALHMGDEVHNRNVAASSLLLKRLAPALLRSGVSTEEIAQVFDFVNGNDHFFINVGMAACKSMLMPASGVPGSSMLTVMARNGVEFGIRLSGTGDRWYTGPARPVEGLFFSGFTKADAAGDIGDSAITETAGVGGFAMAAAPAIVQFVGGTPSQALEHTQRMTHISLGRNPAFTIPILDFAGSPAGIDARKVVDTGILPVVNTGIAHKDPGVGQVGAGVTTAPMECFVAAVAGLRESLGG